MPSVRPQESREAFLQRCVPLLIKEGRAPDQAAAICNSMYDKSRDSDQKGSGTILVGDAPFERVLSV